MDNSQIISTVSKLEQQNHGHEKRLQKLEETTNDMPKFEYLMQVLTESQKEHSETMSKVNENLTKLNNRMDNLDNRVGVLEETKKDTKKKAIDFVLKIIGGLVLAYLLVKTGW